jgi:hypothetical protein
MKPNDENAKLPPEQRPFSVLIISGSDRRNLIEGNSLSTATVMQTQRTI